MGFSIDSTVGELLDNPLSRAFIDQHMPELPTHPMLAMARSMPLRAIAPFSGGKLSPDVLNWIQAEFQKMQAPQEEAASRQEQPSGGTADGASQ